MERGGHRLPQARIESRYGVKKVVVLIAVSAALVLSGCGRVASAVDMEGASISETTVQSSIDAILAERTKVDTSGMQLSTGDTLNRAQVRFFIIATIFDELAKELKIDVTPTEILTRKQGIYTQIGGEEQLPTALVGAQIAPQDLDTYLRATIISDKLTQGLIASGVSDAEAGQKLSDLVVKKAESLKIEVNPRYGKWDYQIGDVVAATPAQDAVTTPTK